MLRWNWMPRGILLTQLNAFWKHNSKKILIAHPSSVGMLICSAQYIALLSMLVAMLLPELQKHMSNMGTAEPWQGVCLIWTIPCSLSQTPSNKSPWWWLREGRGEMRWFFKLCRDGDADNFSIAHWAGHLCSTIVVFQQCSSAFCSPWPGIENGEGLISWNNGGN